MNELIQKLAEESGLDARTMGFQNNHTEQWNARVSKLTQLILGECVSLFDGSREMKTVGLLSHTQVIEQIKKHFGVEE